MVSHFKNYFIITALVAVVITYKEYEKRSNEQREINRFKNIYAPLVCDLLQQVSMPKNHSCCQCCDELKQPHFVYMDAEELYAPLQNDLIITHSA